ncbi:uncharacterized protein EHS24_003358 [Apiotrichum porosum]|uniref:Uncharacterized protein n=1 Tax=Apiotrichum porosum TaxID=105984 RepID=A0A427XEV7_9TREE|nr:uncharacterized protein EHS24_003358 [Apiotrichum porosum]RSH77395.1 hypothetical protein EHS24_003358 [Apiotrichum porosum]
MLFNVLASLLATSTAVEAQYPGNAPSASYTLPNKPANGWETVSSKFWFDPNSIRASGYYAAAQWWFSDNTDVFYFGLQPMGKNDSMANLGQNGLAIFSCFGKGVNVVDSELCYGSADGGDGVSCRLNVNLDFGHWYEIIASLVDIDATGRRTWNGTLVDDQGTPTHIGSWSTDPSFGAIKGDVAQWFEFYSFNGQEAIPYSQKECQFYTSVHFGLPTGYPHGPSGPAVQAGPHTGVGKLIIGDKCAVAANTPNQKESFGADGSVTITGGFLPGSNDNVPLP